MKVREIVDFSPELSGRFKIWGMDLMVEGERMKVSEI